MTAELRPCPNCGCVRIIVWTKERSDIPGKWRYCACEECALQSLGDDDVRGARGHWNEGIGLHFVRARYEPYEEASE